MEQRHRDGGVIFVGGPVHTMSTPAHVEAVRVDGRLITSVADKRVTGWLPKP